MTHLQRINGSDSLKTAIIKMCDGNPGTLMALGSLAEVSKSIDPDSVWGEFSACIDLDAIGIYGEHIWVLYQDICHGNPALVHACLRAVQLGLFPEHLFLNACSRQDRTGGRVVPIKELYAKVCKELPNFDPDRIGEREGDGQLKSRPKLPDHIEIKSHFARQVVTINCRSCGDIEVFREIYSEQTLSHMADDVDTFIELHTGCDAGGFTNHEKA